MLIVAQKMGFFLYHLIVCMYLNKCVFPLLELEQLCISQKGRKKVYGMNIELIRGVFSEHL